MSVTPCDGTPETAAEITKTRFQPDVGSSIEVTLDTKQFQRVEAKAPGFLQAKQSWEYEV